MTQALEPVSAEFTLPLTGPAAVPWRYLSSAEHVVAFLDADGVQVAEGAPGVDFTVTPEGNTLANAGVLALLGDPPALAASVRLRRRTDAVQPYVAVPGTEGIAASLDRVVMVQQEDRADTGSALRFDFPVPALPRRASSFVATDPAGNPVLLSLDSLPSGGAGGRAMAADVRDFGVIGDGSADDTAKLIDAWAWGEDHGDDLWHPPGSYVVTDTIPMRKGFRPLAPAWGGLGIGSSFAPLGAQLVWQGANTGSPYMVDIKAAASDQYVHGWGWENLILNGNNRAFGGVRVAGGRFFNAGAFGLLRCRGIHMALEDVNDPLVTGDVLTGQGRIDRIQFEAGSNAACLTARGLVMRGTDTEQPAGLTQLDIGTINGSVQNANGVEIGDMDSWTIGRLQVGTNAGYKGILARGPGSDGNNRAARKGEIGWVSGNGKSEAGTYILIRAINGENSSWERDPGAVVIVSGGIMDKDTGAVYRDPVYVSAENIDLSIDAGAAVEGAPVRGTTGAQAARILAFAPDETGTWQWTVPMPERWRRGRFNGFRLIALADAGTGPAVFRFGVSARPEGGGFGAAFAYATNVTLNLTTGFSRHEIIFDDPIANLIAASTEIWQANTFLIRLSRLGLDAADTLAAHALVLGFRPMWQEAGPGGDYSFNTGGTIVGV